MERLDGVLGELGARSGSPFMTREWLRAWWEAFGGGDPLTLTVRRDGEVVAGAFCRRSGGGAFVTAPANSHSGDWDVFAVDEPARAEAWRALSRLRPLRARFAFVPEWTGSADTAARAMAETGYRVVRERGPLSPFMRLPASRDELMRAVSRNLRSQVSRRRHALEREGRLALRTSRTEAEVARDLDVFLAIEASGWKGRQGTAIAADRRTERLYRSYAIATASTGTGRLHLLELDDVPIAGDLEIVQDGVAFLLKTGYEERWGRLSPGLVLRADVLGSAIEEGLRGYDFLGGPDGYKMRWTADVRARVTLFAYREPAGYWYRASVRPRLKRLRATLGAARR